LNQGDKPLIWEGSHRWQALTYIDEWLGLSNTSPEYIKLPKEVKDALVVAKKQANNNLATAKTLFCPELVGEAIWIAQPAATQREEVVNFFFRLNEKVGATIKNSYFDYLYQIRRVLKQHEESTSQHSGNKVPLTKREVAAIMGMPEPNLNSPFRLRNMPEDVYNLVAEDNKRETPHVHAGALLVKFDSKIDVLYTHICLLCQASKRLPGAKAVKLFKYMKKGVIDTYEETRAQEQIQLHKDQEVTSRIAADKKRKREDALEKKRIAEEENIKQKEEEAAPQEVQENLFQEGVEFAILQMDATKKEIVPEAKAKFLQLVDTYKHAQFEDIENRGIVICDIPFGVLKADHDQAWDRPKLEQFAQNCCALAGEKGVVWVMCGDQQVQEVIQAFQQVHRWENSYVNIPYLWIYPPSYNPKGFRPEPIREAIFILCFTVAASNLNFATSLKPNKYGQSIFCRRPRKFLKVAGETDAHRKEQKPEALVAELLCRCNQPANDAGKRGVVYDLTQGTGTTGAVALSLNFFYIGNDTRPTPSEVYKRLCTTSRDRKAVLEEYREELNFHLAQLLSKDPMEVETVPVNQPPTFNTIDRTNKKSAQTLIDASKSLASEIDESSHLQNTGVDMEEDREGHSEEKESSSFEEDLSASSGGESSSQIAQVPAKRSGQGPPEETAQEEPAMGDQGRPMLNKGKKKILHPSTEGMTKFQREVQTLKATRARIRTRAAAAKR
jgi:hypothetical protein